MYSVFNKIFKADYHSAFGLRALSIDENGFFPTEITKAEDELKVGQHVNAKIIEVDTDNEKIGLSIKELEVFQINY